MGVRGLSPGLIGAGLRLIAVPMARLYDDFSTFSSDFFPATLSRPAPFKTECAKRRALDYPSPLGVRTAIINCGKCPHCLWQRRNTYAGSVELERQSADWCRHLVLTIAPGPARKLDRYDKEIDPRLVQNFHKTVRSNIQRKKGSFVGKETTGWRYVQAGEYGGKRGRAHYHMVIFGKGDEPDWAINPDPKARVHIPEWPWGHVNVSGDVTDGIGFYLGKYFKKKGKESWYSQSSGYALGAETVRKVARRLGGDNPQGITAMTPTQDFKLGRWNGGKLRHDLLRGAKKRELIIAFADQMGVAITSLAKCAQEGILSAIKQAAIWKRKRDYKDANGVDVCFFAGLRIELNVVNEIRIARGLLPVRHLDDLVGKPEGWKPPEKAKSTGPPGLELIKNWGLNAPSLHDQETGFDALRAESFKVNLDWRNDEIAQKQGQVTVIPACTCADCMANFGPVEGRGKPKPRRGARRAALERIAA